LPSGVVEAVDFGNLVVLAAGALEAPAACVALASDGGAMKIAAPTGKVDWQTHVGFAHRVISQRDVLDEVAESGSRAGAPITAGGVSLGALCVLDPDRRRPLSAKHRRLLCGFARMLYRLLEERRQAELDRQRLEAEALASHRMLRDVIDALPEGVVYCDADDRIILWNKAYGDSHPHALELLRAGVRYEDFLRQCLARAPGPDAQGREAEWLAERMAQRIVPNSTRDYQLADGRWIRSHERRAADGACVGLRIDITGLKQREESFRLLFEANPLPMYVFDRERLNILAANDAAVAFYGHDRDAFSRLSVLDLQPPAERAAVRAGIAADGGNYASERPLTQLRADGSEVSVFVYGKALTYGGQPASLVAIVDMTERERTRDELHRARAFLDTVVDSIPACVYAKDMAEGGRYVLFNKFAEDLLGRRRESVLGRTDHDVYPPDDAERFMAQDHAVLRDGAMQVIDDEPVSRIDGETRYLRTKKLPIAAGRGPEPRYVLGISEDITDRRRIETRISHMAHHDALTDLPNRSLFRQRLEAAIARSAGPDEGLAIHWLDLDNFKNVNDTLGHPIGDALLRSVALRLRGCLRVSDTAARLGGDEFAVLQTPIRRREDAAALASRLVETLGMPYEIEGHRLRCGASIGIALSPQDDGDPDILLRNADIALYRAKADGRGTFRFYEAAMNARVQVRRALEVDLRRALDLRQFELYYQPIVDIATQRYTACEALLRWRHPTRGLVPPSEFIPLAEDNGMIVPIGEWVLRQACAQAAAWPAPIKVAVNLSAAQFSQTDLVGTVLAALAVSGLAPSRLELEITEAVRLIDNDANLAPLRHLHEMGARVSLDDFGTGSSSLSYLRSFPFDKIKIDGRFVRDIVTSPDCRSIVQAVTRLGASLGITTAAEGVETLEQLRHLRAEGCDEAQGCLFGAPMTAEVLSRWLERLPLVA
jgi:diguanylate cyclase (GGDEF)-like protein/PAS domain S-box-containing protein